MDCLLLLFLSFRFFFPCCVFYLTLFYLSCPQLSIDIRGQLWISSSESAQLGVSCDMRLLREGKQYRVFGRRRGYLKFSCWSVLRLQSCVYGQLPDLCRIKHFITRHLALHKQTNILIPF